MRASSKLDGQHEDCQLDALMLASRRLVNGDWNEGDEFCGGNER